MNNIKYKFAIKELSDLKDSVKHDIKMQNIAIIVFLIVVLGLFCVYVK